MAPITTQGNDMPLTLKATVKPTSDLKDWFIEIYNSDKEETFICKDLKEFEDTMTKISSQYSEPIDNVSWECDKEVHPAMLDEVRLEMRALQDKYIDEPAK
ncbi:MAG: hypothetical protein GX780_08565 [Campylobacteraceae bacterium]|nr:hypothetical protein [Campylobacteraceae bacterium]